MHGYAPGKSQPSFDKQYLRDWLSASGWDKRPPAPVVPEEVILQTQQRYLEAYRILTGKSLAIPQP
jgi:phosphoribosylaminoimidazole-succinocarboxamide synthase